MRRRFGGKETGHRSSFEASGQVILQQAGVKFEYEPKDKKIRYTKPSTSHLYLPDYILDNQIHLELKGIFSPTDRKKHLLIKEQYPKIDVRLVFQEPNKKLSKKSKTTYAKWCEKNGIKWGTLDMIVKWAKEPKRK